MKIKIYKPERLDKFLAKKRDKSEDFKVLGFYAINGESGKGIFG